MAFEALRSRKWKYITVILIWIALIGVSIQARSLLTENISSQEEFTEPETESGIGRDLYQSRFNKSGSQVTHIIVIEIPEGNDITSNKWRNFTLYLSLYLNDTMYERGYDTIASEPLVRQGITPQTPQPIKEEINAQANSLISDDKSVGLINLISSTLNYEDNTEHVNEDVHTIRDLLSDVDEIYEYTEELLIQQFKAKNPNQDPPENTINALTTMPEKNVVKNQTKLLLTGEAANFVDIVEVAEETFRESEVIAVIFIIIILAMVFRSPLGIFIPLFSMVAALFPTYLLTFFLSELGLFGVSDFLPSIIAMIGIAVAVDYNLFSLVRYREEYRKRKAEHEMNGTWNDKTKKETQEESAKLMNRTAGQAVMYSGITVMIGFSALIILGSDFTLGMAIGVSLVVLLSIFTARTFTPAILALFGDWLDWPNWMSGGRKQIEEHKQDENSENKGFWVRWSKIVMRYPIVFLIIGILIIAPFITLSAQTQLSFNQVNNLPAGTESRQGFEVLQNKFNLGELNPYRIVIDGGENNSIFSPEIINATNEMGRWALDYKEKLNGKSASFQSFTSLSFETNDTTGEMAIQRSLEDIQAQFNAPDYYPHPNPNISQIPNFEKQLFVDFASNYLNINNGNNTLIIDLTSNLDPGSSTAWGLVDVIRSKVDSLFGSIEAVDQIYVTGSSASFSDSSDDLYGDVPLMLTLAVVLIFIALTILFRSLLLPAKAILTISGSILFGLGTLVYVFQHGNLLNIELWSYTLWQADQTGITFFIPVFLFTTILGLGMDYSIFIISRIREEHEKGKDMGNSVGLGLAKTAGVITSAATIMTGTFMVFALSPMLILKTMGLAMAIAIVIDATVARIILLPAAMKLAGKYNFWLPEWLKKILPKVELKH